MDLRIDLFLGFVGLCTIPRIDHKLGKTSHIQHGAIGPGY